MEKKFDSTLLAILKEVKTIPKFFDIIFGFLSRRTDFYHMADNSTLEPSLRPKDADLLLMQMYKKHCYPEAENASATEKKAEVETGAAASSSSFFNHPTNDEKSVLRSTDTSIETYMWSQTLNDLHIEMQIPEKIPATELLVYLTCTTICVKVKCTETVLLEGTMCGKCRPRETNWYLDGQILHIYLEKMTMCWWYCFLQNETEIDMNKVDMSKLNMDNLDTGTLDEASGPCQELYDEARAVVNEFPWNQNRPQQAMPNFEQSEMNTLLQQLLNLQMNQDPTKRDSSMM